MSMKLSRGIDQEAGDVQESALIARKLELHSKDDSFGTVDIAQHMLRKGKLGTPHVHIEAQCAPHERSETKQ